MGLNILIAEDDYKISDFYSKILPKAGHKVTLTKNGIECLQEYVQKLKNTKNKEPPYDVVVIDFAMPKLSGIGLATKIQKFCPTQRMIFVTAYESDLLRESPQCIANIEVVKKPFQLHTFLGILGGKHADTVKQKQQEPPFKKWDRYSELFTPPS
jgi:two-component system cell cycle response regulator CpdR